VSHLTFAAAALNRSRYLRIGASVAAAIAVGLMANAIVCAWRDVGDIDFHVFYASSIAWRTGQDLYPSIPGALPNLNPPQFIVAFTPFTLVSEQTAIGLWSALNLASLFAAAGIIWRELKLSISFTSVMVAIAATGLNIGLVFGIEEGHPVGIFTLCLTAAWAADRRGRWKSAAVLLGLLASVKPFFACVLLIALCRGRWKTMLWALGTAAAGLTVGIALCGTTGFIRWLETGRQVSWFHHPLNASIAGFAARAGIGWEMWALVTVAVLGVTAAAVRRSNDLDGEWLACGLVSLLASPLGWAYYLPLAAGPLTAIAIRHRAILLAGIGFVWPVPFAMALVPTEPWANMTLISLTSWSLLALWCMILKVLIDDDRLSSVQASDPRAVDAAESRRAVLNGVSTSRAWDAPSSR
jgi:alpha-1,2-mannosyltransferase